MTVYPELHVGWHVDPLARELPQSPAPPFVGTVDASQGGYAGSKTPTPSALNGAKTILPLLAAAAPMNFSSVEMVELMSTSSKLLSLGSNSPTLSA